MENIRKSNYKNKIATYSNHSRHNNSFTAVKWQTAEKDYKFTRTCIPEELFLTLLVNLRLEPYINQPRTLFSLL